MEQISGSHCPRMMMLWKHITAHGNRDASLSDWTDEQSDTKICERYSVGPGDIYGMVESVTWLLHASAELTRMFASAFHPNVKEYEICMKNGTRRRAAATYPVTWDREGSCQKIIQ